jgi:hypothetical protein
MPGIGLSLVLLAAGAVLAFAVTTSVSGISIPAVGVILMAVGGLGLLISLVYMATHSASHTAPTTTVVTDGHDHVHDA